MSGPKIIALSCTFVVVGAIAAWLGFEKASRNTTLAETKMLRAALMETRQRRESDAVFRQVVVARYYRSLSKLDASLRAGLVEDFGPLDKALLAGIPIDKDPVDLDELYLQVVPRK
jgi:hypothetical protein